MEAPPSPLSSRPKRTRISYHAEPDTTAHAAFVKESSTRPAGATNINRKSGVAEWRDLRFLPVFQTQRTLQTLQYPDGYT
jgi:hypothetical protein